MLADLGLSAGSGFGFTLNPKIPNPLNPLGEFDGQLPSDSRWLGFVAKVKALSQRSCNCDWGKLMQSRKVRIASEGLLETLWAAISPPQHPRDSRPQVKIRSHEV